MSENDERGQADSGLHRGDLVRITAGKYKHFEAIVDSVDHAAGKATVMFNVFGRHTPTVFKLSVLSRVQ